MAVHKHSKIILKNGYDAVNRKPPEEDFTTQMIGDFGRWQLWTSVLMILLKLPLAWYQLNIIFMAPSQDFWCAKPDVMKMYSEKEWRQICAPQIEEYPCLIFDPILLAMAPNVDRAMIPLVPCTEFVYDTKSFKRTIISDWDLVCSKHWLIHLTQCVMMWGVLLGGIIFGILADKYGRKDPLMIAIVMQSLISYIASVLVSYWVFLTVWFILALASGGIQILSFVICMEAVSGKWRTLIPIVYQLPFGIGNAVLAGLAYWLRDWRKLEIALATVSSLYILYWFKISESPRWLIATGRTAEAIEVLTKAAKQNGMNENVEKITHFLARPGGPQRTSPGFMAFLRSKNMRMITMLLSANWFCMGLAYYTFSQLLGSIGANVFLITFVSGIISTSGGILCIFIIARVGRKKSVGIFQLITTVCFISLLLLPKSSMGNNWLKIFFSGIGFAGMAGSISAFYLYSAELFPTLGRNIGLSGVTTFARIASMIAPAVVSLEAFMAELPLLILSVTSMLQILFLIPLPETNNRPLPDTIEQAEQFSK